MPPGSASGTWMEKSTTMPRLTKLGIRLFGERVRNDYLTMATKACSEADVISVLGMNLSGSKVQYCTGHYKGKKLILVNNKPHYTDKYADYVVEASPEKVMSSLLLE